MRVLLTGGTGFIGRHLVSALVERGDECVVVSRSGRNPWRHEAVDVVTANPTKPGEWQKQVSRSDAVVNLAGERIVDPPRRWTRSRKRTLRESRIETTRNVARAICRADAPPKVFVSASAIGYYGSRGDQVLDESSGQGDDFLARLCVDWEHAAIEAETATNVAIIRSGIVLGKDGGALPSLLRLFKLGLGGPWGSGRQWWSWIHLADQVGIILLAVDGRMSGEINLTAPNPVTVNEFAATLGRVLKRPAVMRVPETIMRVTLGDAAAALLDLQRVVPRAALDAGYRFGFPDIGPALESLLTK
ncbi:MAG: TIGR01777 family oxidoreductase [Gemmatimonadales bacterium]